MITDSIRHHINQLVLITLFCAVPGCAALSYGTYSGADGSNQVILKKAEHYWAGVRPDILDFGDFKLIVKPLNWKTSINIWGPILPLLPLPAGKNDSEYYSERNNQTSFLVTFWLEPKGHEISFDPFGISLRTSNGDEIKSIGYWGISPYFDGCLGYEATKVKRPPQALTAGLEPISFTATSCFTVLFGTRPPPEETFVLTITGLRNGAEIVPIKPIRFVKRSGWNYSITTLQ